MTETKTDRLPAVCKWMRMTQDQVIDKFYGLKNAFSDGEGDKRFVYVPGTRSDRVLLVAHADTVWGNTDIKVGMQDNILFSLDRERKHSVKGKENCTIIKWGRGIGADDRAGCAIAWYLRDLGHSILITGGEEKGCIGSRYIMNNQWWKNELNANHHFAIQFDRRGYKDLVFYDVGTKAFVKYAQAETGYTPATGSFTDIRHLCVDMCGVNISVGYYNEHSSEEKLVYDQWLNTLHTCQNWLSKTGIPKYALDKTDRYYGPSYTQYGSHTPHGMCGYSGSHPDDYGYQSSSENDHGQKKANTQGVSSGKNWTTSSTKKLGTSVLEKNDGTIGFRENIVMCPFCLEKMTDTEWYENQFDCIHCDKTF
jgi:hypothetical protein